VIIPAIDHRFDRRPDRPPDYPALIEVA